MNTTDLEMLVKVVRLGSFAAAAREMNVDPSSISRAIATLERQLGARLFQRSTRRMALTEAGHAFATRLAPLLEELALAGAEAADATSEIRGRLRISVSNTFGLRRVVPLLPQFCERHPALVIDLMLSDAIVDLVAERIDVAVRMGSLHDSALVAAPLGAVRYRVVASPDWLGRQHCAFDLPQHLAEVPCLTFALPGFRDRWQFRRDGDGEGPPVGVPIQVRALMTSGLALRECVLQHMGPSLLPDWLIDDDIASGDLTDLFPAYHVSTGEVPSQAWAVYPSRSYIPAKTRLFIDFLRQAMHGAPPR